MDHSITAWQPMPSLVAVKRLEGHAGGVRASRCLGLHFIWHVCVSAVRVRECVRVRACVCVRVCVFAGVRVCGCAASVCVWLDLQHPPTHAPYSPVAFHPLVLSPPTHTYVTTRLVCR